MTSLPSKVSMNISKSLQQGIVLSHSYRLCSVYLLNAHCQPLGFWFALRPCILQDLQCPLLALSQNASEET